MSDTFLFTSESVTEGHPDKMADQISDSVLDAVLAEDPTGRVACETFLTTGIIMVGGEISTTARVDIPRIARELISTQHAEGTDAQTLIKPDLAERVLHPILPGHLYDEKRLLGDKHFFYCNPTGKFVVGGPMGDSGLTGRKIIVDTYGGAA